MTFGSALHFMNSYIKKTDPRATKNLRYTRRKLVKEWLLKDSVSRWWISDELKG